MRAAVVVVMLCSAVVACGPDLGNCDLPAAQKMVYLNGIPYVEGQALIHQSCAGSFCHAAGATGAARSGAPHGLDFDVAPMTKDSTATSLTVLQRGVNRVRDEAEELWSIIETGEMPPGEAGDRPDLAWTWDAAGTMPAMLTAVDLDEARQKVRNWLACAAPVVAATTDSPQAAQVRALNLGAVEMPGTVNVGATFDSIYTSLLVGCESCHRAASPFPNQALNFSTADAAFMTLVGKDAFSGAAAECAGSKLVIAGNCVDSLLYQKLLPEGMQKNACGAPMPLTGMPATDAQRKAVCDWINAGAAR